MPHPLDASGDEPVAEMGDVAGRAALSVPSREGRTDFFFDTYGVRILTALRRIIRGVDVYSRKLASDYRITGPQLVCLYSVVKNESLTLSALAREVSLSSSTLIGIVDRLESKGLVCRRRDHQDRRKVRICVTEEGRKVAEKAPSLLQDKLETALRRLPDLEQATIALSLERVVDLMKVGHIEAPPFLVRQPENPHQEMDENNDNIE